MGHDVFISHSSHDREVAHAALRRLEEEGVRCWIAPRDILPGQDYGTAIVEAIRGARIFLLVFSSRSNESPQVKREVERAANADIPIVPLRIEEVTPSPALEYFISGAHWLDAIEPPLDRHLDYLADAVGRILSASERAPVPVREASAAPPPAAQRHGRLPLFALAAAVLVLVAALVAWTMWSGRGGGPPETKAGTAAATIFTRRAVPLPSARQLRLRAAPSQDAEVIALIAPDEVFRVAPRNGDWWPARRRSGDEGFVSHRWIRVIDEEPSPAAAAPGASGPAANPSR